jgi:hypothetical protein
LPIWLSGYVYTKKDYDAYLHKCAIILRGSGGRATLLHGGILWHLAVVETWSYRDHQHQYICIEIAFLLWTHCQLAIFGMTSWAR